MSIRVLLVDDHRLFCDGLRLVVAGQPGMEVVGTAENGRDALRLARETRPDVVLMDVAMPDLNGIDATRQLLADLPGTRVIALSMHADRRYVSGMIAAGVAGYLVKDCVAEELARAIRAVVAGQVYLSPRVAGVVVGEYAGRLAGATPPPGRVLTPREREVLQLVAEGQTSREIAAKLHVSTKTVETHRRQIMDKLGLRSVAELTKYAIREGLCTL